MRPTAEANRAFVRDRIAAAGLTESIESTVHTLLELNMSDLYVGPAYRPDSDPPEYQHVEDFESTWDDADGVWLAEMHARRVEADNVQEHGPYPTAIAVFEPGGRNVRFAFARTYREILTMDDDYIPELHTNPWDIADFSDDELGEYDPDNTYPEVWQESDANPEGLQRLLTRDAPSLPTLGREGAFLCPEPI
jgi:hypothetical protein